MVTAHNEERDQTVFEYLRKHPGMTTAELAIAVGKSTASVAGILSQLFNTGRIIKSGLRDGSPTWGINDMPYGCTNKTLMLFNRLLKECRNATT
ncbi:FaeA/PapI family transcriptional regulator [Enterobacter asburiae]|uniref:FaeA/PapI family transcriptional regulator n=1 Tax=Enterobacter asburiae TaxID=61645 RepID=UPI0021D17028|nr:FaeA/PapI family transcriptional regulator [Enterobacter asburiae]MCU6240760.1 FaeA/PapI family transcriptional regulator [Enterobacter asburiae]